MLRTDADNEARLRAVMPRFDALRDEKIRARAEIDRATKDVEAAQAELRDLLGTDDPEEVRRIIDERSAANTRAVDEFVRQIENAEARLAEIETVETAPSQGVATRRVALLQR